MANYFYMVNPKVAQRLGLTSKERYTFPDGVMMVWAPDLKAIDRMAFYNDRKAFLARLGAVEITDPQAAAEQRRRTIRLPQATDPMYMWDGEQGVPGTDTDTDTEAGPDTGPDTDTDTDTEPVTETDEPQEGAEP